MWHKRQKVPKVGRQNCQATWKLDPVILCSLLTIHIFGYCFQVFCCLQTYQIHTNRYFSYQVLSGLFKVVPCFCGGMKLFGKIGNHENPLCRKLRAALIISPRQLLFLEITSLQFTTQAACIHFTDCVITIHLCWMNLICDRSDQLIPQSSAQS